MNMRLFLIICILSLKISSLTAQTISELCQLSLPVVVINTENNEIPTYEEIEHPDHAVGTTIINATKVPCSITIRLHDDIMYESGDYNADSSGATIRVRGNTSALGRQKPYKLKLEKKADLLLRNNDEKYKDNEFLLLSTLSNCLKTKIGFTLNELMDMPYKTGFRPVNVFLNNEYQGLYYLVDSVKRNKKSRINVDKGAGYIFEYDAYWWNEDYSIPSEFTNLMKFTLKYPDTKTISDEQKEYIESWIQDMQYAILEGNSEDYLYLDTCSRWIISQDLLGISDGAGSNLFLAKKDNTEDTKAYTPTLWDFDSICLEESDWSSPHKSNTFLFYHLFENDEKFVKTYCQTWLSMSKNQITQKLIKALEDYAESAEGSDFEKSYNLTLSKLKSNKSNLDIKSKVNEYGEWFTTRNEWMDQAINNKYPEIIKYLSNISKTNEVSSERLINDSFMIYDPLGRRCRLENISHLYYKVNIINKCMNR